MKQETMFPDYPELSEKSGASVANLEKMQRGLLVGLGAVLTYAVLAVGSSDVPFDSFASVFLWWMLFLSPVAAGLVIWRFHSWQIIPLALRKDTIMYSFGLGFLVFSIVLVVIFKWNRHMVDAVVTITFLTLCYGAFLLWLHFYLGRQIALDASNLFP